jgi:uncharacterized protein YjeT (DUF2065 family)
VVSWGLVKIFYLSAGFRAFIGALLKVEDLSNTVILMLPLAFSIVAIINGLIHWVMFEKIFRGFSQGVIRTIWECLGTSVVMGAVAYGGLHLATSLISTSSLVGILLQGFLSGMFSIGVGILILRALHNRELAEIWQVVCSKFWKTTVVVTDPEIV